MFLTWIIIIIIMITFQCPARADLSLISICSQDSDVTKPEDPQPLLVSNTYVTTIVADRDYEVSSDHYVLTTGYKIFVHSKVTMATNPQLDVPGAIQHVLESGKYVDLVFEYAAVPGCRGEQHRDSMYENVDYIVDATGERFPIRVLHLSKSTCQPLKIRKGDKIGTLSVAKKEFEVEFQPSHCLSAFD